MLEVICAIVFISSIIFILAGQFIMLKPSKKEKELMARQKLADMFCDFYKTITGEKVQIVVKLDSEYEYIIKKEAE